MWLWESGAGDKSEEDESDESERGFGVAAYLVWTAVSSVVEQVTGRLTAAALSDQQWERRGCLFGASLLCSRALKSSSGLLQHGSYSCTFGQHFYWL